VKSAKGLTIIELLVVLAIIGLMLAMAWKPIVDWPRAYRFEATGRAFINAAHAVRIQAISGLPILNVASAPTIGIQGSDGQKKLTVFLDTITFTCDTCGTVSDRTPTADELPIKVDDYVELTGFNQPDYLNGNLFRVTSISPSSPAVSAATPSTDKWGHKQWKVTNLSFDCESCSDENPSNCLVWTDSAGSYSLTTGKVQPAACLKFIQNRVLPANQRVPYSIVRNKTGSTVECYYDAALFDVRLWANGNPVTPYKVTRDGNDYEQAGLAIVYDFAGSTRNHINYLVSIRKLNKGVVDTGTPPLSFNIDPSGRVRLWLKAGESL
jgi:prepilin-type N-terminal cleavage/methylation domain-containing protein